MSKVKGTGLLLQLRQQQQGCDERGYGVNVRQRRKRRKKRNEDEQPPFYIPT